MQSGRSDFVTVLSGICRGPQITPQDHLTLKAAAKSLPLEVRARILPEERLEASLLLSDEEAVEALVREEKPGIAEERRKYLFGPVITRNRELIRELQELYEGRCQLCLWNPQNIYGEFLCQGHHIQWLSRGGEDSQENLMLICPNHHVAIHRCDAPFDYGDYALDFGSFREKVRLDRHLF